MSAPADDLRVQILEADIDCRAADLIIGAYEVEDWDIDAVILYIRAAYAQGYSDAMRDPNPHDFFRRHGYKAPRRASA